MSKLTKEGIEKWRVSFKTCYITAAQEDLNALCDLALSALEREAGNEVSAKKRTDEQLQAAFRRIHKACYGVNPDGWTRQYHRDVKLFKAGVRAAKQHECGGKFFMAGFNAETKSAKESMVFSLRGTPTAEEAKALGDVAAAALRRIKRTRTRRKP